MAFPADLLAQVEAGTLSPGEALRLYRERLLQSPQNPRGSRAPRGKAAGPEPGGGSPGPAAIRRGEAPGGPAAGGPAAGSQQVQRVLGELETLVGLAGVKRAVREIAAMARVQEPRRQAGLKTEAMTLHMIFTGHPGTGKTTVARVLGRLFQSLGLLSRGHLVEVERADLVGEYIGHTAVRTREVIHRALGGVLFIDEAYSLARGGEKDFGKEAIDCLVKAAEDHRRELLIILAGYPEEMEWFLVQNSGLRSRFPICITFPDYSGPELYRIAEQMLAEREYRLTPDAASYLRRRLEGLGIVLGGESGNARAVRNLVERAIRCQALRMFEQQPGREELMILSRADLEEAFRTAQMPRGGAHGGRLSG